MTKSTQSYFNLDQYLCARYTSNSIGSNYIKIMNNFSNKDKELLDRFNTLTPSSFVSEQFDYSSYSTKLTLNLLELSLIRAQFKDSEKDLSIQFKKLQDRSFTPPEDLENISSPIKLEQDPNETNVNLGINQLVSEALEISTGQTSVEREKRAEYENLYTDTSSEQDVLKPEKSFSTPSFEFIEQEKNQINNEALASLLDSMSFDFEGDEVDKTDENQQSIAQLDLSNEIDDVIAKVMDEVSFEQAHLLQQEDDKNESQSKNLETENEELIQIPDLPSIPTSLCHSNKNNDCFSRVQLNQNPKVSAELSCGLNSIDFKPIQVLDKPISQLTELCENDFNDSNLDDWCIICQDDARIRCLSCDGDLYCLSCWEEGHISADAGLEERNHRWVLYKS